jgi:hypothetical protein
MVGKHNALEIEREREREREKLMTHGGLLVRSYASGNGAIQGRGACFSKTVFGV